MDLRQLRYFTTLAETLNFHRASERLNISQPPLTVAIRKLEDSLGARLFVRESRGVRLTDAGRAALPVALATLAQASVIREAVHEGRLGESGTLSLGFVGSAISAALPRIIPAFRARYPKVELRLDEMTSISISRALAERRIDVGLVRLPLMQPEGLEVTVVERDQLVVALLEGHRLARSQAIKIAELADEPFVLHGPVSVLRSLVLFACQSAGFTPRITQDATQVQTILSLVQSGLGVALVPGNMVRIAPAGVRLLSLVQPIPIEMGIAVRSDAEALTRNFVALAKENIDS